MTSTVQPHRTGLQLNGDSLMGATTGWFSLHCTVTRAIVLVLACCTLRAAMAAAEPAACLSSDPKQWPQSSKPYFLVIVDTSGSMGTTVPTGANSCGYQHNRIGDARCAVKNMVTAYGGVVNFGLVTYAWRLQGCPAATCATCDQFTGCFTNAGCTTVYSPSDNGHCGPIITEPNINAALNASAPGTQNIHAGGYVVVPISQDNYWDPPANPNNVDTILAAVDNNCGNGEIGANANTPLGGVLYNMKQYLQGGYTDPFTSASVLSPIGPATFLGSPAERACRSINVILITDGDETCDAYNTGAYPTNEGLAVFEAGRLLSPGVTVSGLPFSVKTYVIGFLGATTAALDNIAAAGGTTSSYSTANEAQIFQALSNIIGGSIRAEVCDNLDNNCNGCTDEGYAHYADQSQTCCASARGHLPGELPRLDHQRQSEGRPDPAAVHDRGASRRPGHLALLRPGRSVRQHRQQRQRPDRRDPHQVRHPAALPASRGLQRRR